MRFVRGLLLTLFISSSLLTAGETPSAEKLLLARAGAAYKNQEWRAAARLFSEVAALPCDDNERGKALFYSGMAHYKSGMWEEANETFNLALQFHPSPDDLLVIMKYKFATAEALRRGGKTRLYSLTFLPRWGNGRALALELYDEIISTVPATELAAKALYSKASLLADASEFGQAIDTYQQLVHRFRDSPLAPKACCAIITTYLRQARSERQNFDFALPMARSALRRFQTLFPDDKRIETAKRQVAQLEECAAFQLYETGAFYERVDAPRSAELYYGIVLHRFPQSAIAEWCRERLRLLAPYCTPTP